MLTGLDTCFSNVLKTAAQAPRVQRVSACLCAVLGACLSAWYFRCSGATGLHAEDSGVGERVQRWKARDSGAVYITARLVAEQAHNNVSLPCRPIKFKEDNSSASFVCSASSLWSGLCQRLELLRCEVFCHVLLFVSGWEGHSCWFGSLPVCLGFGSKGVKCVMKYNDVFHPVTSSSCQPGWTSMLEPLPFHP